MAFDYIFERHGSLFARTHSPESSFGKVQIFEILNVFEYGLTHIEGFGTTGAPRELVQALFNGLREPNSQHDSSLYKYSTARQQFVWKVRADCY